jgi:hypothetical protein
MAAYATTMQVVAFSSPSDPQWRWRILDYSGVIVEESRDRFATISAAVAAGTEQLVRMNVSDRAELFAPTSRARRVRNA